MSNPSKPVDPSTSKKQTKTQFTEESDNKEEASDEPTNNKPKAKPEKLVKLHPLEDLLGATVKHSSGATVSPKTLAAENGFIGLYFAAHWCPPCRLLTPQLAILYEELKNNDKKFEVVYVSLDYSEESFTQYFSKMPWYAVQYEDMDRREELVDLYGIRGIPMLIILESESCQIVTRRGREIIILDPLGALFPWNIEDLAIAASSAMTKEKPASLGHQEDKQIVQSNGSQSQNKLPEVSNNGSQSPNKLPEPKDTPTIVDNRNKE